MRLTSSKRGRTVTVGCGIFLVVLASIFMTSEGLKQSKQLKGFRKPTTSAAMSLDTTSLNDVANMPETQRLNDHQALSRNEVSSSKDRIHTLLPSLDGVDIPSNFNLDSTGNLVKDMNLQLYFDILLSAQSDLDNPEVLFRIVSEGLEDKLQGTALDQALDLWQRYTSYSQVMSNFVQDNKPANQADGISHEYIGQFKLLLDRRTSLQKQMLPDVYSWFEEDNEFDRVHLQKVSEYLELGIQPKVEQEYVKPEPLEYLSESNPNQLAYDTARDQILHHEGLSMEDKKAQLKELRRQYYEPGTGKYAWQKLKDMKVSSQNIFR